MERYEMNGGKDGQSDTKLTEQVVVKDHSELGQLHRPSGELHGEDVRRRREAVRRHPEVTPRPGQKTKQKTKQKSEKKRRILDKKAIENQARENKNRYVDNTHGYERRERKELKEHDEKTLHIIGIRT